MAARNLAFSLLLILIVPLAIRAEDLPSVTVQPPTGDAGPALRAALASLPTTGGILRLAPGRYDCHAALAALPSIVVAGYANLHIIGHGAVLVGGGRHLLTVHNCRELRLSGITIDWSPAPWTTGRAVAVAADRHTVDLELDDPAANPAGRPMEAAMTWNVAGLRPAADAWEVYHIGISPALPPLELIAPGRIRAYLRPSAPLPTVGSHLALRHKVYQENAVNFIGCERVLVEDVTVHSAAGMGLYCQDCRDVTLRRLHVQPSPGSLQSTAADATHFKACRGTITLESCIFAGMGDDGVNIHGLYGQVTKRTGNRDLLVQGARLNPVFDRTRGPWELPLAGDVLETSSAAQPLLLNTSFTVASAQRSGQATLITADADLPATIVAGSLLANISTCPAVRISQCTFRGNRARGILVQTRDVVIEQCAFTGTSGPAIQLCCDADQWCEGPGTKQVSIRDCTIDGCNFGVTKRLGAIDVFADLPQGKIPPAGVHAGITITNNRITCAVGSAIHLGSATDVELSCNTLTQAVGPALCIDHVNRVSGQENRVVGKAELCALGAECTAVTVAVSASAR